MERSEFEKAYLAIVRTAVENINVARTMGLLVLEERIDEEKAEQRDIFHYGMRFMVDGTNATFIDKLLSNIINQETDEDVKLLKNIQKEAVLRIQDGTSLRLFVSMLNSYVDNTLAQATWKDLEKDDNEPLETLYGDISKLSRGMASVDPNFLNETIPAEILERTQEGIFTTDDHFIEAWFADGNKTNCDRVAFRYSFSNESFHCFFGFIRSSKNQDGTKEQSETFAGLKYEFCAVSVINRKDPHKGIWGRNDFEDEDFERVAETLLNSASSRSARKLDTIITEYNLIKCSFLDISSLCGERIKGKLIRPTRS
jgi:hypothetical protein